MKYSGFKKVHEDSQKAILKHKNGSELKIAKASLAPKHLEALKALPLYQADGSYGGKPEEDDSQPQPSPTPGAPVNIYVGGQQPQQQMPTPQPAPTPAPRPQMAQPAPQPQPTGDIAPQQPQPQSGLSPQPEAQQPQQPMGQQPEQAPEAPAPEPEAPRSIASAPKTPTYQDVKNNEMQKFQTGDQAWDNDLNNGHITPKTYSDLFASKSTLGKIGTVFGLMLSGAGSGLAHQPNAALSIMQQEIDNDLKAQIKSKDNALNYIKANQEHLRQQAEIPLMGAQAKLAQAEADQKAYALSKMQMNRAAFHSLVQQNQKLPLGSPARNAGDNMLGMMYQAINSDNFDIADRAASASALANFGTQQGGSEGNFQQGNKMLRMSGNAPLAQDAESKHYPGLQGQASGPLGGGDRDKLDTGIRFDRQLHDFMDWTKKHSGSLSPSAMKEGVAKAAEVQAAYRAATNGGVYKEGEQNFISKIIDSHPTKFFNSIRVMPQLNAVAQDNQNRIDQTAKNLGFNGYNGYQGQNQDRSSGQWDTIERFDPKTKRTVIYDAKTKTPLRFK